MYQTIIHVEVILFIFFYIDGNGKRHFKYCNTAVFCDYKSIGITEELYQIRNCIINSFSKRIPHSRILVSLSIIDDGSAKINDNDIEKFIENVHDLKENILYMLAFEKLIRDEQQTDRSNLNDNDEQ